MSQKLTYLVFLVIGMAATGCGPNPNEEQIRTQVDDTCEGPAELRYSKYGGFQIRVSPCKGREVWSPVLYGEEERAVTREIDAVLKKFKFRCSVVTHTGVKTGRSRQDAECQRVT